MHVYGGGEDWSLVLNKNSGNGSFHHHLSSLLDSKVFKSRARLTELFVTPQCLPPRWMPQQESFQPAEGRQSGLWESSSTAARGPAPAGGVSAPGPSQYPRASGKL